MLSSQKALSTSSFGFVKYKVESNDYGTIPITKEHKEYLRAAACLSAELNPSPVVRECRERFEYRYDLINYYNLKNVFRFENDVLIYVYFHELLPIFQRNYKGLATTFLTEKLGCASIMYVPNKTSMQVLADFTAKVAPLPHFRPHAVVKSHA